MTQKTIDLMNVATLFKTYLIKKDEKITRVYAELIDKDGIKYLDWDETLKRCYWQDVIEIL